MGLLETWGYLVYLQATSDVVSRAVMSVRKSGRRLGILDQRGI